MLPTYHLVSHTHWDREWYLSFEQFRAMLVRMVDDLLDLLARDPEYKCFTLDGQTIVLEDCLAIKPERAEEIRRLVAEGRLLVGPWYILPDEFLVSGEATIRNLFFGRRISQQFGAEMMTRFKAVKEIGNSVIETCLNQLIPYDDLAYRDDQYIFFFNPSPFTRSEVAKAQVNFYLQDIVVGLNPDVKEKPELSSLKKDLCAPHCKSG